MEWFHRNGIERGYPETIVQQYEQNQKKKLHKSTMLGLQNKQKGLKGISSSQLLLRRKMQF